MVCYFIYIQNKEGVKRAYDDWKKNRVLGIDIECENNFHHYGTYISLIQISSQKKNWVVDCLRLGEIPEVLDILKDSSVEKIFHGCDFDLRVLSEQYKIQPKNIFDTQIVAQFLGFEKFGLGNLLEKYFGIEKKERFQRADWTRRPIRHDMLEYAAKDSKYLVELSMILKKELKACNRLGWVMQECRHIESQHLSLSRTGFWDIKGLKELTDNQRAVLKKLYALRERFARRVRRPDHFIISTKKMIEMSVQKPAYNQIRKMKGVHPVVRQKAGLIAHEIMAAKDEKIGMPKKTIKKFTEEQSHEFDELMEKRKKIAVKYRIEPYLIMSKDQIKEIILTKTFNSLRKWQRELIKKKD
ncbi:HRDC domain-containing protein [Candidatus Woesearchaeota archaeon]|nr:HRDC domain-containing protein [Candidatus Woesearchaeota archaeon]